MSEQRTGSDDSGATEGESYVRDTQAKQGGEPDLSGHLDAPSIDADAGSGGPDAPRPGTGGTSSGADDAETGEVSAEPSQERREEDPGSVATEFGDRADTAPDDPDAHPSI